MIIQAELKCKQTGCEADTCAVDKVIELPSPRFRQFSRALLADYDFIAENKNAVRHDDDARHCLLVLDAEGKDGFLVDPQGYNYARYSAFVPNARSLLTPDMAIDRSYLSPAEPWRDESGDEMLRMTLRVNGKPDYTLVLPADEEYLDAVKAYLDIDVFADAKLCDIRFKVPYIGELIRDTDCPAVEDYNDFAEALEDIWQQDGALLTYAAVLEAERPDTLRGACELLRNLDNYRTGGRERRAFDAKGALIRRRVLGTCDSRRNPLSIERKLGEGNRDISHQGIDIKHRNVQLLPDTCGIRRQIGAFQHDGAQIRMLLGCSPGYAKNFFADGVHIKGRIRLIKDLAPLRRVLKSHHKHIHIVRDVAGLHVRTGQGGAVGSDDTNGMVPAHHCLRERYLQQC